MGDFFDEGGDEQGQTDDFSSEYNNETTFVDGATEEFATAPANAEADTALSLPPMTHMPTVDDLVHAPGVKIPGVPELDDPDVAPESAPPLVPAAPEPDFPPPPAPDFGPGPDAPGVPEIPQDPQSPAPVPAPAPAPAPAPDGEPVLPDDGITGNPSAYTDNWFWQEVDGICVPSAEAQVISEYTGMDISDPQQLADRAVELGLFPDGDTTAGMTMAGAETLMEDQGVPCHQEQSSMADLDTKLSAGYGVIAFVDSGEIWSPGEEAGEDDMPDHALVVAGIDHNRGVVILSDPGSPDGNQEEVPIDRFADAWADSGNSMLVPDAPDPDLADTTTTSTPDLAALDRPSWAMLDLTHR